MAKTANEATKQKALAALLQSKTFTEAAEKAGIERRTLYNYLHEDENFAWEFRRQMQMQSIVMADEALQEKQKAVETLREIMNNENENGMIRLKAAERIISIAEEAQKQRKSIAEEITASHCDFTF